eukprot:scaffold160768_cov36-Tisochrysis_lutea.AAC.1
MELAPKLAHRAEAKQAALETARLSECSIQLPPELQATSFPQGNSCTCAILCSACFTHASHREEVLVIDGVA